MIQKGRALQQSEKVGQTSTSEKHSGKKKEVGRRDGDGKEKRQKIVC